MAIAFDATSRYAANGTGNRSVNHTCASGAVLFAWATAEDGDYCTGMTYNGVSMTFIQKKFVASNQYDYMYFLGNPDSGTHTLTAVFSSGSNSKAVMGASYTGASTSTPTNYGATAGVQKNSAVTLTYSGGWGVGAANAFGGGPVSSITNGTNRNSLDNLTAYDTNGTQSGSYTTTVNTTGGDTTANLVAELAPASTGSNIKSVDGVAQASIKSMNGVAIASIKSINGIT